MVDRRQDLRSNDRGVHRESAWVVGEVSEGLVEGFEVAFDSERDVAEARWAEMDGAGRASVRVARVGSVELAQLERFVAVVTLRLEGHGPSLHRGCRAAVLSRRTQHRSGWPVRRDRQRVHVVGWLRLAWRDAHVSGGASPAPTCPSFGSFRLPWFTSNARQKDENEMPQFAEMTYPSPRGENTGHIDLPGTRPTSVASGGVASRASEEAGRSDRSGGWRGTDEQGPPAGRAVGGGDRRPSNREHSRSSHGLDHSRQCWRLRMWLFRSCEGVDRT